MHACIYVHTHAGYLYIHILKHKPYCIYTLYIASQTWCLIRLLPLIIGDLVPQDDACWTNFVNLLTITDYVLAPQSTTGIAGYLEEMICEHHTQFKQLYPDRPLTPKFHYMIHLPHWIRQYNICIFSGYT